jgi:hypothetical protein
MKMKNEANKVLTALGGKSGVYTEDMEDDEVINEAEEG